MSNLGKG
jgi:hypothetical protein